MLSIALYQTGRSLSRFGPIVKKLNCLQMKLTVVLLLSACLQISAKGVAQKISISEKNASLEKILTIIERQTNYTFVYTDDFVLKAKPATLVVSHASLQEALDLCFKDQPFTYTILNKMIVILPRSAPDAGRLMSPPAPIDVRGTVKDNKGNPISGAVVSIKGQEGGVPTDAQGGFVLHSVPVDAVLVISFTGYKTVEVPVRGRKAIEVTMEPSIQGLDEVVVVGYGTQKKVNLTGAVASVNADKLEDRPLVNLGAGLEGLIPNLNVNLGSGQPGTEATFNVRGYNTISGGSTAPLILVDGVERDPNLIDPGSVESVTVLKDAASAAIYGGRAAYGVILITTKNAKRGSPPQLTYTGSYTTSRPTTLPDYANSTDYVKIFNSAQNTGSLSGGYTSSSPLTAEDSIMTSAYAKDPAHNPDAYVDPGNPNEYRYVGNTNWMKVLYPGWAPQQQHYLSLSSGEGKTSYAAGLGYFEQDGLEKVAKQVYQRYTPTLKINSDITSWLTAGIDMSMTHTDNSQGPKTGDGTGGPGDGSWIPTDLRPLMPVYNPDGHFSGQGSYTNPVAVLTQGGRDVDAQNDYWLTGRVVLRPVNHLTVNADYTWNAYSNYDKANLVPFSEYGVNGVFLDTYPWTNPSQVTQTTQNNDYTALNAYATYENTFAGKHYVKALVGYNQENFHYKLDTVIAKDLIDPSIPSIGANNDPKPHLGSTETDDALVGNFFRLNYIYDKRYLVEFNARYDGTSRFQPSNRYTFSPSVSAGWNIAEESFMKDVRKTINELKLRASYGELPNQLAPAGIISSAAQYPYLATMPTGQVGYLFNSTPGITVTTPALISPDFTWEKVRTKNAGLDYTLLNGKVSGSFDYFITYTLNMLVPSEQLPAVLGTSAPASNSANLRTEGYELSATWKDRALNNKLFYSITVGLSDNSSTITKYNGNPTGSILSGTYYPGEKLGSIWGYVTQGFYQTDAQAAAVNNSALSGYTWLAGDVKYADLNHDGKIDYGSNTLASHGDQKILGNTTPRYKVMFNLNVSYKGFDFAALVQGVLKAQYSPSGGIFYAFPYDEYGIPYKLDMNYWTPQNTNAYFARPRFDGGGNEQVQTKYLQNAAFGRVKQLTLGYGLPKQWAGKLKLQKLRVYVTGANLITITRLNKIFDPEVINDYQNGTGFNGAATYPVNKSVSFGLSATL
jgi:TonB-linked SusC/RagA family outer membrane protein